MSRNKGHSGQRVTSMASGLCGEGRRFSVIDEEPQVVSERTEPVSSIMSTGHLITTITINTCMKHDDKMNK